jgi:3-hydroxyacyl-CoA dehydrogenase
LGLMGHGICQVAAISGTHKSVIAYEPEQKYLDSGMARIEKSMEKLASKGKLSSEDAATVWGRIDFTTDVTKLKDVDFVCEAVIENIDLKKRIYKELSAVCQPDCIFGSNTSSLSITEMAEATNRPEKFVGMHFFNPVQLMPLVEVINTKYTDPAVMDRAVAWVEDIGKTCVTCGDTPGFIVNRLLMPSLIQAMLMLDRADASLTDIDLSMKLGAGHPMGPIHLADYIGLDTCYFIVEGWTAKYPDEPAFIMPKCLNDMVDKGDLGRKTGKGFYHWEGEKRRDPVDQYST